MNIQEKIAKLNKEIRQAENLKIQAETRLESLENQYSEVINEFKTLGINPENAIKEKEKIEQKMEKLEEEINTLIPHELITDYK